MRTPWIKDEPLARACLRNESFWNNQLEEYPLMWITAPDANKAVPKLPDPSDINEKWTNVDLAIAHAENELARTYFGGDALPVYNPWFGPDQFAAWLGCEMELRVAQFTSWVKPFVVDWSKHQQFEIDSGNKWWRLYLKLLAASVEKGKDKWVTAYPDLHCGIDGLAAIRGHENLFIDMFSEPAMLIKPMKEMTRLFKYIFDTASDIILPGGQGTSNWTLGWSDQRFMCVGHNDVTCMISEELFDKFCMEDTRKCIEYPNVTLYHLDGPGQIRYLERLLEIPRLNCVQWMQGAGNPPPSQWLDMLCRIQAAGKSVQLYYVPGHGDDVNLHKEIEVLCSRLDPCRLFIRATVHSIEEADALVQHTKDVCKEKRSGYTFAPKQSS